MKSLFWMILLAAGLGLSRSTRAQEPGLIEVGVASRDITPEGPIWLAGYAGRNRASEKVDQPLLVQALALRDAARARLVLVSLDNCEVSRAFTAPVLKAAAEKHALEEGRVMIVSSHTHSAPVLEDTLTSMYRLPEVEAERVRNYSAGLREKIIEAIGAALADLKPARFAYGRGRAGFAMNRRVLREDRVDFGENPDGPVDWDVPVLRVSAPEGPVRAILFGYACHGTTLTGEDFYTVSGDYMAYAREHLEKVHPGAAAIYLTGMGADSNPSPRGRLLDARRHGLELAGAVAGVLGRPMRPVAGPLRFAYAEVDLPLHDPPGRERLEADARGENPHVRLRAEAHLRALDRGEPPPVSVRLPLAAVRLGDDLTFVAMGGEVVADYALRFQRLLAADHPWTIGYAYHVPCYIPSMRILREGGYEADSSLIYYGIYGPFRARIEEMLVQKVVELVASVKR